MIKKSLYLPLAILLFSISLNNCKNSCDSEPNLNVSDNQLTADIVAINAYLADNDIDAQAHPSGLRYVIVREGSGSTPDLCDQVAVTYEGRLMSNGSTFDSADTPVSFDLNNLIVGWQIGIPLIKPGGRVRLYIPSVYGYGVVGQGNDIPPNANLIFEILLF